ncbi:MAG TPA: serine/threonine-protein kinase, partial [Polyangiaceae bacterium]|nr:serine/threonine-protein kinase [Polyangiaceae bacterium]
MTTTVDTPDPRVGQVVAEKYRVVRLIGSGGMGSVYEGENVSLGKRVALKFLHVAAQQDETSLARFHREARAISAVESAHIVQVFDWGQDAAGHPFLVMELLDGGDLGSRIQKLGRIPVGDAVRYAIEALRGLRRVHAAGIVHRDLKPENLFLVTGDDDLMHVKIVDFGLSKLVVEPDSRRLTFEMSARLTHEGAIVGTPLYMSPEQIEAVDEIDHRADLWSVGAILFEMLAGSPPFMDRSYARLVMAICQRDPPDLARVNAEVSSALANVVVRALTRDREARVQSADELIEMLSACAPHVKRSSDGRAGLAVSKTVPAEGDEVPAAVVTPATPPATPRASAIIDGGGGPLDATLAAHTKGAATVWLSDAPVFSIWRGEVDSPDRLRIEARDGSVRDLRLEPVGTLRLGRVKQVGDEVNELVYPDVASRLAARLMHDGIRWWIERREECSVPVQVGTRALARNEKAPLVHGVLLVVGAMRATVVDRRYVSRSVPAGTVDAASGLLARGGLEQEVATALQRKEPCALVLLHLEPHAGSEQTPASVRAAVALHRTWPSAPVARDGDVLSLLLRGTADVCAAEVKRALELAQASGAQVLAAGYWMLEGEAATAGSEVELALDAIGVAAGPAGRGRGEVVDLKQLRAAVRLSAPGEVLARACHPKHQLLLFGIEEQAALGRIGPKVIPALEQELAAIISTQVGPSALVTRLA